MPDIRTVEAGINYAVDRFPKSATNLRRLVLANLEFRELCLEYGLAQESLARFEAKPNAAERPEVKEYRTLITELEAEIDRVVREARLAT